MSKRRTRSDNQAHPLLDSEYALLAAILAKPHIVLPLIPDIRAEYFGTGLNQALFRAIRAMETQGRHIDGGLLVEYLRETDQLDGIGGLDLVCHHIEAVVFQTHCYPNNAEDYARTIKEHYARNRLYGAVAEIFHEGRDSRPVDEMAGALQRMLDDIESTRGRCGFELSPMDSAAFSKADFSLEWLVRHVLVKGQPCVIGGPEKSLKTGIVVDLAISLGTGTPFLSHEEFHVPTAVRTCVLSGESGGAKLRDAAKTVCESRNLALEDADVLWGLELPKLADPAHLRGLRRSIDKLGIEVLIIDPAYLSLMAGDSRAADEKERRATELKTEQRFRKLEKLNQVLRTFPDGETKAVLRSRAVLKSAEFDDLIAELLQRGSAEHCTVMKTGRKYDGFRPFQIQELGVAG